MPRTSSRTRTSRMRGALGLLVLLLLLLLVALLLGWLDIYLSGGGGDVVAPDLDVDVDLPDVTVEGGELPDIDVESSG